MTSKRRSSYWPRYRAQIELKSKRRMAELIALKGGKCALCGYSKCKDAMDFHHIDPRTKSFQIGTGLTRKWIDLVTEAGKCILLCSNCHREVHSRGGRGVDV